MLISDWSSDVCSSDLGAFDMEIGLRQMRSRLGFERFELAETSRGGFAFHGGASAFGDRFPGVGLIVHFRGAGTGGASAGGAVVLAFEGDEIGRASCRERVCRDVYISGVAVS